MLIQYFRLMASLDWIDAPVRFRIPATSFHVSELEREGFVWGE